MKDKFNINVKLNKINSISIKHMKKVRRIVHSFLLIFVSGKCKEYVQLSDIVKNRCEIIKSDYNLLKNDFAKVIKINKIATNG